MAAAKPLGYTLHAYLAFSGGKYDLFEPIPDKALPSVRRVTDRIEQLRGIWNWTRLRIRSHPEAEKIWREDVTDMEEVRYNSLLSDITQDDFPPGKLLHLEVIEAPFTFPLRGKAGLVDLCLGVAAPDANAPSMKAGPADELFAHISELEVKCIVTKELKRDASIVEAELKEAECKLDMLQKQQWDQMIEEARKRKEAYRAQWEGNALPMFRLPGLLQDAVPLLPGPLIPGMPRLPNDPLPPLESPQLSVPPVGSPLPPINPQLLLPGLPMPKDDSSNQ